MPEFPRLGAAGAAHRRNAVHMPPNPCARPPPGPDARQRTPVRAGTIRVLGGAHEHDP